MVGSGATSSPGRGAARGSNMATSTSWHACVCCASGRSHSGKGDPRPPERSQLAPAAPGSEIGAYACQAPRQTLHTLFHGRWLQSKPQAQVLGEAEGASRQPRAGRHPGSRWCRPEHGRSCETACCSVRARPPHARLMHARRGLLECEFRCPGGAPPARRARARRRRPPPCCGSARASGPACARVAAAGRQTDHRVRSPNAVPASDGGRAARCRWPSSQHFQYGCRGMARFQSILR